MDVNAPIKGRAWKCGNGITTYQIIEQRYWKIENPEPNANEMGKHLFDGIASADETPVSYASTHAQIIVAGKNFGCGGKSIVHPVAAMQGAGVQLVIAESFSRYLFRNAINNDLPAIVCPGITQMVHSGDELTVDLPAGIIQNVTTGEKLLTKAPAPLTLDILRAGGEIVYYCASIDK